MKTFILGLILLLAGCKVLGDLAPVDQGGKGVGESIGRAIPAPYGEIIGWVLATAGTAALGGVAAKKNSDASKFKKIAHAAVVAIESSANPEIKKKAKKTSIALGIPAELAGFVNEVTKEGV